MKHLVAVAILLPLAACGGEAEVDVENASVEEVAREVAGASADASMIRAGKWESRMQIEAVDAPGMPETVKSAMRSMNERNQVHTTCLTPEDVDKPKEDFFAGANQNCRYDHFTMGDGKIDARMRCTHEGMAQLMEMAGTYSPDSYSMRMTTKSETGSPVGTMSMRMRVDARRVGECDGAAQG